MTDGQIVEIEVQIEKWIGLRRFDLALPAVANLRQSINAAAGNPDARRSLAETTRTLRRLIRLAQAQRAHMAAELNKLTASVPYLPPPPPSSTWRVQA